MTSMTAARPPVPVQLAVIGAKIDEISRQLEEIQRQAEADAELAKMPTQQSEEARHRYNQAMILREFTRIKGGVMRRAAFLELAEKRGYDRRGMAGYYRAGWVRTVKDQRDFIAITPIGRELVARYRKALPDSFEEVDGRGGTGIR